MKFSVTVLILFSVNHALSDQFLLRWDELGYDIPPPEVTEWRAAVVTGYFSQRLDHFDPSNTRIWSQRYFVNDQYFNAVKRDVIFLMISGEGQASGDWLRGGSWIKSAKKYGALLFMLEHRFYGVSQPFRDVSTENLRFLSSRQALQDAAVFINGMNQKYNLTKDATWIAFGGSYAGALVAWLRLKYPHLVQGAVSISGPLHAQLDFHEYLQVVADVLASHSRECLEMMKKAFTRLDRMIDSQAGARNVTVLFNLCNDIRKFNTKLDIANLFRALTGVISKIVQYNTNQPKTTSVRDICDILTNKAYGDEINRLVRVTRLSYKSKCVNYIYKNTVNYARNVLVSPDSPARQWWYQTCKEFGWFQTTGQKEPVFGTRVPVDFHISLCKDIFGPQFNLNYMSGEIKKTNTHFGGRNINVRRVVFVQGSFDPWYPMGLTATTNPKSPVIFINGSSHCATMYGISKNDLPQVTAARVEIDRLIGMWLGLKIKAQVTLPNGATNSTLNVLLLVTCNFVIYKH